MLIRVKYPNGSYDMVNKQTLDFLLEQDKIAGFKRTEGWALVGRDPIRNRSRQAEWKHDHLERRGMMLSNQDVR
jgi:hypothetical protein